MKYLLLVLALCSCGDIDYVCPCDCETKREILDNCNTGYVHICYGCDKWDDCYPSFSNCWEIDSTTQCCLGAIDPCPQCWPLGM